MVVKFILASFVAMIFPMMLVPFLPLKLPPLYQLFYIFIIPFFIYQMISDRALYKGFFKVICLIVIFVWFSILSNGQVGQIFLIVIYLVTFSALRFNHSFKINENKEKILRYSKYLYISTIVISIIQLIAYNFSGIIYLIPDSFYLTSNMFSTSLNNPVSGWNQSFRPNAFYAEPSFMGFFICSYVAFYLDSKNVTFRKGLLLIITNLLFLHFLGIRSGEVILLLFLIFYMANYFVGEKVTYILFCMTVVLFCTLFALYYDSLMFFVMNNGDIDFSTFERGFLLLKAVDIFYENKWFGVGLGNLKLIFSEFSLYERDISNVGNLYVQMLAEVGVVGFLILFIIIKNIFKFNNGFMIIVLSSFFVGGYTLMYIYILPLLAISINQGDNS